MPVQIPILLLNWNRKDDTMECVQSLTKLEYRDVQIVVVDNGSTDGSAEALTAAFPGITVIQTGKNLGYAGGLNAGLQYLLEQDHPYVFILNNDTVVDPAALTELVRVMEGDPAIGLTTGKVYDYYYPGVLQVVGKEIDFSTGRTRNIGFGERDKGQYDEVTPYDFIDGVYWLARMELFRRYGLFATEYFYQFEESDFCARINRDYRILYVPTAKLWHKGAQTLGGKRSPLEIYYFTRNKIIFMKKFSSRQQFRHFLVRFFLIESPLALGESVVKGQFNLILPQVRGAMAGLRQARQTIR